MQTSITTNNASTNLRPIIGLAKNTAPAVPPLISVLSWGGGQDSTAILYLLVFDKLFRAMYAPGKLIVIFSDTMNEFPETYQHLEETKVFCADHNIPFFHILPEMGFHGWAGLRESYRKNTTIGSKAFFSKACTDQLKLTPIYNFLESHIGQEYNLPIGLKQALKQFAKKHGKIRMMVGIAHNEEKRLLKAAEEPRKWKAASVEMSYPLVDLGMDRGDCQRYIRAVGKKVPIPSNCMFCHYLSEQELLWLYRHYPEAYHEWVELEANKLERYKDTGKENHGVWRGRSLPEVLAGAIEKYGVLTNEELHTYKMNHGHCVMSKY